MNIHQCESLFHQDQSILFFLNLFLYFYSWLCWVFISVRGLSPVAASGGHSSLRHVGFFTIATSPAAEHRLQTRRLSNCGSGAQLLRGTWDLPGPGLEPVSPALAGRLSTTEPPGKPWGYYWWRNREFMCPTQSKWPFRVLPRRHGSNVTYVILSSLHLCKGVSDLIFNMWRTGILRWLVSGRARVQTQILLCQPQVLPPHNWGISYTNFTIPL